VNPIAVSVAADWHADPAHWAGLRAELPKTVAAFVARDELAIGMPPDAARAALNLPARELIAALVAAPPGASQGHPGRVVVDAGYLRIAAPEPEPPPGRPAAEAAAPAPSPVSPAAGNAAGKPVPAVTLPPRVASAVQAVLDDLAGDPFTAPDGQRLRDLGLDARALAAAARAGLLLRIADLIVLAPGADKEAARLLAELPQPFTTSQARQALGTSRRVAIPLLEYLDRARVTERLPGDLRRLRPR
jgi:selenocysteine-specific elongation factor